VNSYAVRQAWNAMKVAALAGGNDLVPALAQAAIEKWASVEAGARLGHPREMREAFASSVAGAAMVDVAIEKLAEAGRYTEAEREFMLDLNAEAAVRDLQHLCKTAGFLTNALQTMQQHPKATGAVVGGAVGAGLGAWKDDENRLRGAVSYGVPGAAIGAMAGHAYQNHQQNQQMGQAHNDQQAQAAQQAQAQAAQQAQAASMRGMNSLDGVSDDAARWHKSLVQAVNSVATNPEAQQAHGDAIPRLQALFNDHSHDIIQHAVMNPGKIHPEVAARGNTKLLKEVQQHAQYLYDQGAHVPLGTRLHPEDLGTAAIANSRSKTTGAAPEGP